MLATLREDFNARFTPAAYAAFLDALRDATGEAVVFRVCETPCFFPRELVEEMADTGCLLTEQLLGNPAYLRASDAAIPERFRVADESPHPHFMTVDFGLVQDVDGSLRPKLVEMQAFPSLFGYQELMSAEYVRAYDLAPDLKWLLSGHTRASYWELLRRILLNGHPPEQVVLTDVDPATQKTRCDFYTYAQHLGIAVVDIAALRKEGNRLYYQRPGSPGGETSEWLPIARIYNRAIVDEIERRQILLPFDYRDRLEVEWAGHPNWYFRISKFSLPWLDHASVPTAVFLNDYLEGRRRGLPEDREQLLLKPLYSFAGKGIVFAPTDAELAEIPVAERASYLIQERVDFAPVIHTPHGPTQVEVRILYLWPDGEAMQPVIALARMGRGRMMGVDQNKGQQWVGGSAVLFR